MCCTCSRVDTMAWPCLPTGHARLLSTSVSVWVASADVLLGNQPFWTLRNRVVTKTSVVMQFGLNRLRSSSYEREREREREGGTKIEREGENHWRELPQVSFLSRQKFCRNKHATKLSVATKNIIESRQNTSILLSRQARVFRDKNDTCGSSCQ